MDQKQLLEITEQYLKEELSSDEKKAFEDLRSTFIENNHDFYKPNPGKTKPN
jgi:hypothetical protein